MKAGRSPSACPSCLRRSWLLAQLASFIERSCDDRPGRRIPEILALGDEELVRAVAPRRADAVLSARASLTEGDLREMLDSSASWAICRHDGEWPVGLAQQADGPVCLIGKGDSGLLRGLDPEESVTIVGSRRATAYGVEVARRLGGESARAGLAVVSGMAAGIDGAVHRGSIGAGRSIAVLGGSVDRPYPASNRGLYRELVERGVVVSEMPPGTRPRRWCFPARNRIMASLSGITVVVEAASRSGSLITAEMALAAGREVGAVPGPVTSPVSSGCNDLIRCGAAVVRDGFDLVETLAPGTGQRAVGPDIIPEDPVLLTILEAVSGGASTVDLVGQRTGIDVGEAMIAITKLEFLGLLEVEGSGRLVPLGSPVATPRESTPGPTN